MIEIDSEGIQITRFVECPNCEYHVNVLDLTEKHNKEIKELEERKLYSRRKMEAQLEVLTKCRFPEGSKGKCYEHNCVGCWNKKLLEGVKGE